MERSHDPPPKPEFFKVLVPDFLVQLPIPRAFIKNIIKNDCRNAILLSPLGKPWRVEIHGDAHPMHFGKGWKDFSRAHRLRVGYFLVFRYEGNMVFSVTVFDLSGCKKEYTLVDEKGVKREVIDLEDEEDRNTECISEGFGRRRPRTRSRERTLAEVSHSLRSNALRCAVKRYVETGSGNPQHFVAIMRRSYVTRSFHMPIPMAHKVSYGLSKPRELILRDPEGRSWTVSVSHTTYNGERNCRPFFGSGWREFVLENNLVVGDKCVFQLVCRKKMIVLVHILKQ